MSIFRVIGERVVSEPEFLARDEVLAETARAQDSAGTAALARGPITGSGATPEFRAVGKGRPLQVVIDHVYTGKHPKRGGLFGRRADMAVLSGVKDYSVFAASTRALNLLSEDVEPRSHLRGSAFQDGTPLVLYSPAVMTDSLTLTIELAADTFDGELFSKVASGFSTAAGIPLMLPHSGYLLGVGELLKLAGGLGDALFDSRPAFSITETLNFGLPGRPLAVADHWLLTHEPNLHDYSYDPAIGLRDSAGAPYSGDEPYVVITLDGGERAELNAFTPTAASAAVLQRFLSMKDGAATSVDTLIEAIRLASDLKLRGRAETLKQRIATVNDPKAKEALQKELDAIIKNIGNEVLRPD